MSKAILVTGAGGNLGREAVKALLAGGCTVKAGTRDAAQNVEHWS